MYDFFVITAYFTASHLGIRIMYKPCLQYYLTTFAMYISFLDCLTENSDIHISASVIQNQIHNRVKLITKTNDL